MRSLVIAVFAATVVALAISGMSRANPAMQADKFIDSELLAVAVGDRIRRECDDISARMVEVWSRARALERYAKKRGFSGDEIDGYLDSKPDQERFKTRARSYLQERGAKKGDSDGHCKVGRAEIAAKSPIGTLLKAR